MKRMKTFGVSKKSSVKFEKLEIKVLNVLLQHIYLKKIKKAQVFGKLKHPFPQPTDICILS